MAAMIGMKLCPLRVNRHLGRNDTVVLSVYEPAMGERLELAAEDAWSDLPRSLGASRETGPDLAITKGAVLEIPHDAELVFPTDHLLERHDRATACRR
jgi:hypothetical protein